LFVCESAKAPVPALALLLLRRERDVKLDRADWKSSKACSTSKALKSYKAPTGKDLK